MPRVAYATLMSQREVVRAMRSGVTRNPPRTDFHWLVILSRG